MNSEMPSYESLGEGTMNYRLLAESIRKVEGLGTGNFFCGDRLRCALGTVLDLDDEEERDEAKLLCKAMQRLDTGDAGPIIELNDEFEGTPQQRRASMGGVPSKDSRAMNYRLLVESIRKEKGLGYGAFYDRETGLCCALGSVSPRTYLSGNIMEKLNATPREFERVYVLNDLDKEETPPARRDRMLAWAEAMAEQEGQ